MYQMQILILVLAGLTSIAAHAEEEVPEPGQQCPILISQAETRIEQNPPQNASSVAQARELLSQAKEAQQAGDYQTCMDRVQEAFKSLNKT